MTFQLRRPTSEQAEETAQKFGVSVEEVYRQWDETERLGEEGGVDAVMASMASAMTQTEDIVDAMVELADMDPARDRAVRMGEFLHANLDKVDPDDVDKETLLHALLMAAFKLAEADARVNVLLDGSHRRTT